MDERNWFRENIRDNVTKKVHWDLCKRNGLEHTEKWHGHVPEGAVKMKK